MSRGALEVLSVQQLSSAGSTCAYPRSKLLFHEAALFVFLHPSRRGEVLFFDTSVGRDQLSWELSPGLLSLGLWPCLLSVNFPVSWPRGGQLPPNSSLWAEFQVPDVGRKTICEIRENVGLVLGVPGRFIADSSLSRAMP